MNREVHVRFWEGLGVRFPWATQLLSRRCDFGTSWPRFWRIRSASECAEAADGPPGWSLEEAHRGACETLTNTALSAVWVAGAALMDLTHILVLVRPNVRAKRATTAGRQARAGENVPRTTGPGLVACRWRSA